MRKSPRILFVEDHEDTRNLITLWLGRMGYEVVVAESTVEGLRQALTGTYDLYLLDSRFEDGSGTELCAAIRAHDEKTPIIFYSGDHPARLKEATECSVQGYVMKPGFDVLPREIARALDAAA